jgi:hypothetical protein
MLMALPLAGAEAAEAEPARLVVKPGTLTGKVADLAGEVVSDSTVTVLSQDGERIATTRTDEEGRFKLKLREGHYRITVGDLRTFHVVVRKNAPVSELALIVPSAADYSASQLGAAGLLAWATSETGFLGLSTAGAVAAGGGVAGATAAGISATEDGGGGGDGGGWPYEEEETISP